MDFKIIRLFTPNPKKTKKNQKKKPKKNQPNKKKKKKKKTFIFDTMLFGVIYLPVSSV